MEDVEEPVGARVTAEVAYSERNSKLLIVENYKFGFHKALSCGAKRYKCSKRGCRAYLKIAEPATVVESSLRHEHDGRPAAAQRRRNLSGGRGMSPADDGVPLKEEHEESTTAVEMYSRYVKIEREEDDSGPAPKVTSQRRRYLKKFTKPINITKRSKKFTDLQTKIGIIQRSNEGARTSDISKLYDLPWTTVDSILKNKERYLDAANNVSGEVRLLKSRQDIFVIMEEHLMAWIYEEDGCGRALNSTGIRKMAKQIFDEMKEKDPGCKAEFSASKGWFNRFLGRSGLKSLLKPSEAPSIASYEPACPPATEDSGDSDRSCRLVMEQIPVECVLKGPAEPEISSTDDETGELSASNLRRLFGYVDLIKEIVEKDPLKDRAFLCYNAIQSACLPYRIKLQEMETKGLSGIDSFFGSKITPFSNTDSTTGLSGCFSVGREAVAAVTEERCEDEDDEDRLMIVEDVDDEGPRTSADFLRPNGSSFNNNAITITRSPAPLHAASTSTGHRIKEEPTGDSAEHQTPSEGKPKIFFKEENCTFSENHSSSSSVM